MGLFDFLRTPKSDEEIQREANARLAELDLREFKAIPSKLVGVSLDDPDGAERQALISRLQPGDVLQIHLHTHKGMEIVDVMTPAGKVVGNLPVILAERLHEEYPGSKLLAVVDEVTGSESTEFSCIITVYAN